MAEEYPSRDSMIQLLLKRAYGQYKDRTPAHGYEETREAATAAFAKSWRREES
jgi:hypothetical protein